MFKRAYTVLYKEEENQHKQQSAIGIKWIAFLWIYYQTASTLWWWWWWCNLFERIRLFISYDIIFLSRAFQTLEPPTCDATRIELMIFSSRFLSFLSECCLYVLDFIVSTICYKECSSMQKPISWKFGGKLNGILNGFCVQFFIITTKRKKKTWQENVAGKQLKCRLHRLPC